MLQAECLQKPGVLQGRNLVYSAPTSAGKSAVSGVLMLRRLCRASPQPCLQHKHPLSKCCVLQAECLQKPGVLQGRNLVYSAPTSAGKSAVSEVLMLRRLCAVGKPALVILPFRALCQQKAEHYTGLLKGTNKCESSWPSLRASAEAISRCRGQAGAGRPALPRAVPAEG